MGSSESTAFDRLWGRAYIAGYAKRWFENPIPVDKFIRAEITRWAQVIKKAGIPQQQCIYNGQGWKGWSRQRGAMA